MWRRYLLWFAHEHVDMRHAEMESILSMYKIPMRFVEEPRSTRPYWLVELPSEESARKIASRSISLKNCIELWGRAKTANQLHVNLRRALQNSSSEWQTVGDCGKSAGTSEDQVCPSSLIQNCCTKDKSFKVHVETFGNHLSMAEKVSKIESFSYLPLEGPVSLKSPDVMLMFLELYNDYPNNNSHPEAPLELFFGRWVTDGQRHRIQRLSLKSRKFIGNTSMDAQLSLLMANQARARPGDLVLDPFVGSGSLLVAAADYGAYVWGSDIDFMMLHGRTRPTRVTEKVRAKDESIRANMRQYGLEQRYLDVLVSDFALPLWREGMKFDSIITDPPYGVREPTERIGIERENYTLKPEHLRDHVPAKVEYDPRHMFRDLLAFAARHLRRGGRLVCWYPLVREEYDEKALPSHPCLKLIANSEQVLSAMASRRLLTYEKEDDSYQVHSEEADVQTTNFREKYFSALGDVTRRERREKKWKSQERST